MNDSDAIYSLENPAATYKASKVKTSLNPANPTAAGMNASGGEASSGDQTIIIDGSMLAPQNGSIALSSQNTAGDLNHLLNGTATINGSLTNGGFVSLVKTELDNNGNAAAVMSTGVKLASQQEKALSTADATPAPTTAAVKPKANNPRGGHVCNICSKGFAKREHLTKHLRIHDTTNKRFSCEYCQKAFRDRYELVRHARRHTGDFAYR